MKIAMYIIALLLGMSLVTLIVLSVITQISPASGTFEGNAFQAWAGTLGFAALYLLGFSTVTLLCLGATYVIRHRNISNQFNG